MYNTLNNASDNLVLEVSIGGGYNSNLDWASDYLWALFIGENIAEFCESIVAKEQSGLIEFVFIPKNLTELTSKLIWLATPFEEDSEEDIEFQEIYHDFAESLETRKLHFPEIADGYLANFVGGECDLGDKEVEELHKPIVFNKIIVVRFPQERLYDAQKCAKDI